MCDTKYIYMLVDGGIHVKYSMQEPAGAMHVWTCIELGAGTRILANLIASDAIATTVKEAKPRARKQNRKQPDNGPSMSAHVVGDASVDCAAHALVG